MTEPTFSPPPPATASEGRTRRYALIAVAVAVIFAVWGIASRLIARNALEHEAASAAIVTVATTHPLQGPAADDLVLPGTVQAFYEAPIYARTSGYLRELEDRHRHHRDEGPAAGRDRRPGGRPGAAPGAGRPRHRPGELRARPHHQRALAGTARHAVGIAAGRRPARRRCRSQGRRAPVRRRQPRPPASSSSLSSACWHPSTAWSPSATPTSAR